MRFNNSERHYPSFKLRPIGEELTYTSVKVTGWTTLTEGWLKVMSEVE